MRCVRYDPIQNGKSAQVDTSQYHTYRLTKPAGSGTYTVQVDGQTVLTQDGIGTYPPAYNQLWFGDGTCQSRNGSVEIDYVRIEQNSSSLSSAAPGVLANDRTPTAI